MPAIMSDKVESLNDLETGVEQLLRENRCSFTDEEKKVLEECLVLIQRAKFTQDSKDVLQILGMVIRLFIAGNLM